MNVVAYTRVSTNKQLERNRAGLPVQQREIEKLCAEQGHLIVAWHSDRALSGSKDLGERVGLAAAIADLKAGVGEGLVLYRADRLARDMILQEQLLAEIWSTGARVVSCSSAEDYYLERDDPKDPSRRFIRQVLGAMAEYERGMIRLRMRMGAELKAANGCPNALGGRPPFGWHAVDRVLVPVESEQVVLRMVHGWHGEGLSSYRIAALLNARGLVRPGGGRWHHEQVRRALAHAPAPVATTGAAMSTSEESHSGSREGR